MKFLIDTKGTLIKPTIISSSSYIAISVSICSNSVSFVIILTLVEEYNL